MLTVTDFRGNRIGRKVCDGWLPASLMWTLFRFIVLLLLTLIVQ